MTPFSGVGREGISPGAVCRGRSARLMQSCEQAGASLEDTRARAAQSGKRLSIGLCVQEQHEAVRALGMLAAQSESQYLISSMAPSNAVSSLNYNTVVDASLYSVAVQLPLQPCTGANVHPYKDNLCRLHPPAYQSLSQSQTEVCHMFDEMQSLQEHTESTICPGSSQHALSMRAGSNLALHRFLNLQKQVSLLRATSPPNIQGQDTRVYSPHKSNTAISTAVRRGTRGATLHDAQVHTTWRAAQLTRPQVLRARHMYQRTARICQPALLTPVQPSCQSAKRQQDSNTATKYGTLGAQPWPTRPSAL